MTLSIMTLSIMTLRIMALIIVVMSVIVLSVINTDWRKKPIVLSFVMLSDVMLIVSTVSVLALNKH
jgi:hypothetical protein